MIIILRASALPPTLYPHLLDHSKLANRIATKWCSNLTNSTNKEISMLVTRLLNSTISAPPPLLATLYTWVLCVLAPPAVRRAREQAASATTASSSCSRVYHHQPPALATHGPQPLPGSSLCRRAGGAPCGRQICLLASCWCSLPAGAAEPQQPPGQGGQGGGSWIERRGSELPARRSEKCRPRGAKQASAAGPRAGRGGAAAGHHVIASFAGRSC